MVSNDGPPPQRTVHGYRWKTLIEVELSLEPGNEPLAMDRVAAAVQKLNWPVRQLERLRRALATSIRNTLERSRLDGSGSPLRIQVLVPEGRRAAKMAAEPANQPTPRGWGFFLIQTRRDKPPDREAHYLIELFLYQEKNN
jgi:hypothetical protein